MSFWPQDYAVLAPERSDRKDMLRARLDPSLAPIPALESITELQVLVRDRAYADAVGVIERRSHLPRRAGRQV